MKYCLICHEKWQSPVTWHWLLFGEKPSFICMKCESRLAIIAGETCQKCNRPFSTIEANYRIGEICRDCDRWEKNLDWQGVLTSNTSLFLYNNFLKEVIAQYKYRGDYQLAKAFQPSIQKKLQQHQYDYLIPIPLSKERLEERGFNQSAGLIKEAGFEPFHALSRTHSEKQSKKSRKERIRMGQVFRMKESLNLEGKTVLIIDDIYTTGSTLRQAAKVLREAGAQTVSSLTIARG